MCIQRDRVHTAGLGGLLWVPNGRMLRAYPGLNLGMMGSNHGQRLDKQNNRPHDESHPRCRG